MKNSSREEQKQDIFIVILKSMTFDHKAYRYLWKNNAGEERKNCQPRPQVTKFVWKKKKIKFDSTFARRIKALWNLIPNVLVSGLKKEWKEEKSTPSITNEAREERYVGSLLNVRQVHLFPGPGLNPGQRIRTIEDLVLTHDFSLYTGTGKKNEPADRKPRTLLNSRR